MRNFIIAAAVIGAVSIASMGAGSSHAYADNFNFSFDTGGVGFAFNDGYWDRDHHWHRWHNQREHRAYREQFPNRYTAERHTRYRDAGWADFDHDGVPDRLDRHPRNPNRD